MIRTASTGLTGEVWEVTLDRPHVRNALDLEHWQQLASAVREAPGSARVVVVTGAGPYAFCAGADVTSLAVPEVTESLREVFRAIAESPLPVLAYLNGAAVGAGAMLAATCDLVMASPAAHLAVPAAELGLPVEPETLDRLVALIGLGPVRAMLIGGERLGAERAHQLGLVSRLGDHDEALRWATDIAALAPLSVQYFTRHLRVPAQSTGHDGDYAAVLAELVHSADHREALAARREKRAPRFQGR
jgi:enoyl-CoA hydratase